MFANSETTSIVEFFIRNYQELFASHPDPNTEDRVKLIQVLAQ